MSASESCEFCQLLRNGRSDSWVAETETCVAFLDRRPLFLGHTLVVPRDHYETLLDLPTTLIAPLFAEVQRVARAVQAAVDADGTFVAMNNTVSQSVPTFMFTSCRGVRTTGFADSSGRVEATVTTWSGRRWPQRSERR